jgi:hypothetical protein
MATWDDVRRIALALPETMEDPGATPGWRVRKKSFAWERPLRKGDLEALGASAPSGPILGVRTADVGVKEALVANRPDIYFTTPHFDNYPAILVQVDRIDTAELTELLTDAWIVQAPKRVAKEYLDSITA